MSRPAQPDRRCAWLARPLEQAPLGKPVRIVRIDSEDPLRTVRLSSLGLVPGTSVRLRQKWPALIIGIGETVMALDSEMGSEIHVTLSPEETG